MSRMSLVAVVAIAVGALACSGGGGTEPGPDPQPNQGSITISPGALTLSVGGRGTLSADVRNASGATISATVAWTSRNGLVASVDNSGTVIGVAVGQTMAVATANGMRDSVLVIVLDDLTLQVTPASATVQTGGTFPFTVVARNGAGQVIATPAVTWATSSSGIATVNASGIATGVAKGTALITASARGVTSTPGVLTVADASASCDGINSVQSWQATLDTGAVVEIGRGSDEEAVARTLRFVNTVRQVTSRYQRPLEYADLRHTDGYAVRLRGVSTVIEAEKPKKK